MEVLSDFLILFEMKGGFRMEKKSHWFHMPKKDGIFILFLVIYVVLFFLPWSYEMTLLNISLLAWGASFLFLLAPVLGIVLTLAEKSKNDR